MSQDPRFAAIDELRKAGYCVAVYSPDELYGIAPETVESVANQAVYGFIRSNADNPDSDDQDEEIPDENQFRR